MRDLQTPAEFDELRGSVVVDFWAPWCGPCRAVAPVLDELALRHAATQFVKVNVDDLPELAARFEVMSIPTIMHMNDGQVVSRVVGARGADALESELRLR